LICGFCVPTYFSQTCVACEGAEFIKYLIAKHPTEIPRWQMKRLAGICKHVAGVVLPPLDELYSDEPDDDALAA
jgi:hypothetical protein